MKRRQLGNHSIVRRGMTLIAAAALLIGLACSNGSETSHSSNGASPSSAPFTPSQVLSVPGSDGQTVAGIQCQRTEQIAYHIHAHLTLIVDGRNVLVPAGIGIAPPREEQNGFIVSGRCFYWLHTHDLNGIIHIESPTSQIFTLGQFFAVWGQPLSQTQVATFQVTPSEPLHVFVNGQPYSGAPEEIQLTQHELITIEIGNQVPPPGFSFPPGL